MGCKREIGFGAAVELKLDGSERLELLLYLGIRFRFCGIRPAFFCFMLL